MNEEKKKEMLILIVVAAVEEVKGNEDALCGLWRRSLWKKR